MKYQARTLVALLALTALSFSMVTLEKNLEMGQYDHYTFTVEWPGTVCLSQNCNQDFVTGTHFNLHGLWPDGTGGRYPSYCTNTPLNFYNLPSDLLSLLKEYWSGLYSSEQGFINHEWTKHGTCWNPTYGYLNQMPSAVRSIVSTARSSGSQNPADFLRLVVALSKDAYNVYNILANAGITPSQSTTYSYNSIVNALGNKLGISQFNVACQSGNLQAVYFCLDKNYQPTDCSSRPSNCGSEVGYPTLDGLKLKVE